MRRLLGITSSILSRAVNLRSACAAAALATAWNTPALFAEQVQIGGYVEPDHAISSAFLYVHFYLDNGSFPTEFDYLSPMGDVPANQRTNYQTTITYNRPSGYAPFTHPSWHSSYSVIGIYDVENAGVSLSFDNAVGAALIASGAEWPFSPPETTVAGWLSASDANSVRLFLTNNSWPVATDILPALGELSTQVAFTPATDIGNSFFAFVPEPTGVAFLVAGALFVIRRR